MVNFKFLTTFILILLVGFVVFKAYTTLNARFDSVVPASFIELDYEY